MYYNYYNVGLLCSEEMVHSDSVRTATLLHNAAASRTECYAIPCSQPAFFSSIITGTYFYSMHELHLLYICPVFRI